MKTGTARLLRLLSICALCGLIAACGSSSRKGGYYKDDGPGANPPANLDRVPDAVPKIEPLARGPNRPYTALGQSFTPDTSGRPYRVQGRASWYGRKFHGKPTSNGERYDMYAMTAAHPTLPIPSYVRVTRVSTGKTVVLRVNDRGPFLRGRVIDLSYVAAYQLGVIATGSAEVIVERIMPEEIRNWRARKP
jgi:rare lipoprotein A